MDDIDSLLAAFPLPRKPFEAKGDGGEDDPIAFLVRAATERVSQELVEHVAQWATRTHPFVVWRTVESALDVLAARESRQRMVA